MLTLAAAIALPFVQSGIKPKSEESDCEWRAMETALRQRAEGISRLPAGTVAGLALGGLAMTWLSWFGSRHGVTPLLVITAAVLAADSYAAMVYAWWLGLNSLLNFSRNRWKIAGA
jgi:hypothetical protein